MPSVPLPMLLRGSRTPQSGWLPRGIADAEQRGHVTAAGESILYCIPTGSDMSASIILCNQKKKTCVAERLICSIQLQVVRSGPSVGSFRLDANVF
jgi:hypothetical protein